MKSSEHRAIGDEATAGAEVDLAGPLSAEPLLLRHGDVIALSGDFFPPPALFENPRPDEVRCALEVMAVDEGAAGGRRQFDPEVERRVRDRFLRLAAANADHFVDPWGTGGDEGSAAAAYRILHHAALDDACRLGRLGGTLAQAMAREAAAQHYLTDAFASGHLRTPIAAIRRYWHERYPRFWANLQRKVAADTAATLREIARPLRLVPARVLHDRSFAAVRVRTQAFPAISLGDLIGRVFHDWDNDHGLLLEGGEMLYGDGHLDEGVGRRLAVAAVRAANDEIEVAFGLGRSGSRLSGEPLYRTVREATGSGPRLPRPSAGNPPLNWRAADVDDLWKSPIAGSSGTTVGQAIAEVLEPGGEVARRLSSLGQGIVIELPVFGGWLGRKACAAYHHGFVERLARDPKGTIGAAAGTRVEVVAV